MNWQDERDYAEETANAALLVDPDPEPSGPLVALNDDQLARVAALHLAAPLLTSKTGVGSRTPDVFDLMRLAEWVLHGIDLLDIKPSDEEELPPKLGEDE